MCAPSPPPPPDYAGAAVAQGAANLEAARATAKLNNPNVINPYGTQTVTYGVNGDPDQAVVQQTFSPEQQSLYNKSVQTKGLLGELGISGATALKGVVGTGVDFSGAPAGPSDYNSLRDQVIDAQMTRVNEDADRARDQKHSQLIAAGIRPGTRAYDTQMQLIQRGVNDAKNLAISNAGTQASQAFQTDTQRRKDAIAEILAQRQTPLNEINALMSGSQVSNPFAGGLGYQGGANVAPAPIFAATQQAGEDAWNAYNAQAASSGGLMSGLFSLGSAGITKFSDRRLKRNIKRIGTHILGIGVYSWRYVWGEEATGVMADEVRSVMPHAVSRVGLFDAVDYQLIG